MNQFGFEFGLVALDEQEVIAAALPDCRRQWPIGEGGVAGDDRALQRHVPEQPEGLDHLAAVGRHRKRSDHRLKPCREGGEHMHARARLVLAAAQPLAVDGDMAERAGRDQHAEGAFQIFGRNRLENIMIGRMAGRAPALDSEHL